ncbi:MAG: hypothetical protein JWP44_5015 [Mucilaginibacter sp.]|nr:hypothetical protein [Mucilaginibacter sp.]
MNDITIFKLDTDVAEDILDLHTLMKEEIDNLRNLYEAIIFKNYKPREGKLEDLAIYEVLLNNDSMSLKIMSPYLIIADLKNDNTQILQYDIEDRDIYAYNLNDMDTRTSRSHDGIMDEVDFIYDLAKEAKLYERYAAPVSLNIYLHDLLKGMKNFEAITMENIKEVTEWVGYATNKKLH